MIEKAWKPRNPRQSPMCAPLSSPQTCFNQWLHRYGSADGRYTSPVIDGKAFSYSERSLPYVEDVSNYHQYEVIGDFTKIEEYIKNCKKRELGAKI